MLLLILGTKFLLDYTFPLHTIMYLASFFLPFPFPLPLPLPLPRHLPFRPIPLPSCPLPLPLPLPIPLLCSLLGVCVNVSAADKNKEKTSYSWINRIHTLKYLTLSCQRTNLPVGCNSPAKKEGLVAVHLHVLLPSCK